MSHTGRPPTPEEAPDAVAATVRRGVALRAEADGPAAVDRALGQLDPDVVARVGRVTAGPDAGAEPFVTGAAASPGVGVGEVHTRLDALLDAVDDDRPVVFAAEETGPADEVAMRLSEAILTARGGVSSHAAVVARGWGIPAVCGAGDLRILAEGVAVGDGAVVPAGTTLTVDGTTGIVHLGDLGRSGAQLPEELATLLEVADDRRAGRVRVLANADDAEGVRAARLAGAEGIGLCRTEHQFLGERLPLVRRAILADEPAEERQALDALIAAQREDHRLLFEAADGTEVTVRLLDPPLHEFLPSLEHLAVREATGLITADERRELVALRRWREQNPMLGTRGVRLGVVRRHLYQAQVTALAAALGDHRGSGGATRVRVMIPLVATAAEARLVAAWVRTSLADVLGPDHDVPVGAMVETPRAALVAAEVAVEVDFLSFGTNDLTQLTFGFSRDDLGELISRYVDEGLLDHDPFVRIDEAGVGRLVRDAVAAARAVRPTLPIGVCGEHAGDVASVAFLLDCGVDSLSCAAPRLVTTRLAVAHALAVGADTPAAR
ncbi:MAG: hypothetical protein JJU45_19010 [Acidimicrobiia bacterium]|nr:hypothetical protein [Acidimicrobiia bacterium]